MYLARYAHQDAIALEREPTAKLNAWASQIEAILREEQDNAKGK